MHSDPTKISGWPLLLALAICFCLIDLVAGSMIEIPDRSRTEGRITFSIPKDDKIDTFNLAFTESIDRLQGKSVVSIGYVNYDTMKYYTRYGESTISVGADGMCAQTGSKAFVPEIEYFLQKMIPVDSWGYKKSRSHVAGPTGLFAAFNEIDNNDYETSGTIEHRNVPCKVARKTVELPKSWSARVELYLPQSVSRNIRDTYFSVRITVFNSGKPYDENSIENKMILIDYYDVVVIADNLHAAYKVDYLVDDFNMPLGRGCSQFLVGLKPNVSGNTFSMNYWQTSKHNDILIAYDYSSNFVRKEERGKRVSIWDLKDLNLYDINRQAANKLTEDVNFEGKANPCAVVNVVDKKLDVAYRPFIYRGPDEKMSMLEWLGAATVAFMGRGIVRDLPCLIFEVNKKEPPMVFGFTSERAPKKGVEYEYIVQFYVLDDGKWTDDSRSIDQFWPTQVKLLRRIVGKGDVEFLDQLDVWAFHWSLEGWSEKPGALFMARECFDDEDVQQRVELTLTFDRIHKSSASVEDKALVLHNRLKLELDIINMVFEKLKISKIHLVDYELRFRPNHINFDFLIGGRRDDLDLKFDGYIDWSFGKVFKSHIYHDMDSEESCIMKAGLVEGVRAAVYCKDNPSYTCSIIFGSNRPSSDRTAEDESPTVCKLYAFTNERMFRGEAPSNIDWDKVGLIGHKFNFEARSRNSPGALELIEGVIKDYEVSHETQPIIVDDYMFDLDQTHLEGVKRIGNTEFESESDCVKLCHLDPTCKSYLYCNYHICALSELDLREELTLKQITDSSPKEMLLNITNLAGVKFYLRRQSTCRIQERDYLSVFRQTDESIRLDASTAGQFQQAKSALQCAKLSVELELASSEHHVTMFAYCPTHNVCLLDESLLPKSKTKNEKNAQDNEDDADADDDDDSKTVSREIPCRIYRKKYQSHFLISTKVLKRDDKSVQSQAKQAELAFSSVEECAHACWNELGSVCASFDFCTPNSCLINQVSALSLNDWQLETKAGCYHYERDLKLDEMRASHQLGRHQIYEGQSTGPNGGGLFMNVFFTIFALSAFVLGLAMGKQVHDRLENVTILPQSLSLGSGWRPANMFGFQTFGSNDDHTENFFESDAIAMDDMATKPNGTENSAENS